MSQADPKAVEFLKRPDDELLAMDDDRVEALGDEFANHLASPEDELRLPTAPYTPPAPVLAIGAPRALDRGKHSALPVLLGIRYTGQREWEVHVDLNLRTVIVDLRTGNTLTTLPLRPAKKALTPEPSRSGPPPDETNAQSVSTGVQRLDLREAIKKLDRRTELAVTVINLDWISNTVVVEISGKEEKLDLPGREPSPFLDTTTVTASTPAIGETGAALSIPAKAGDGPIPVHAAVTLPRSRVATVPGSTPTSPPLLRGTLLLVELDGEAPLVVELAVPADPSVSSSGEKLATACFGFDLRKALKGSALKGPYQAYLAVGDRVAGPYPIALEGK